METFLPSIEKLSPKQVEKLIHLLGKHAKKGNSGVRALRQALLLLPDVAETFKQWKDLSKMEELNKNLKWKDFFSSNLKPQLDLLLNTELSSPMDLALEDLDPYLLLLYELRQLCPAFASTDNLLPLGLQKEHSGRLDFFFQRRKEAVETCLSLESFPRGEGTSMVRSSRQALLGSRILQQNFRNIANYRKRRDYENFKTALEKLDKEQSAIIEEKIAQIRSFLTQAKEEKEKIQLTRQLEVLNVLINLKVHLLGTLYLFIETRSTKNLWLADYLPSVYSHILQVCENSVALIFIGLIKTGKSTVVDAIVGQNVSPARIEPMTAIPIRYVHDPDSTEPVLLLPFSFRLNQVLRGIQVIIKKKELDLIGFPKYLANLAQKIKDGHVFKEQYKGQELVLETCKEVHDVFRLTMQPDFEELIPWLPLSWPHGLDSFLTILLKFPGERSPHIKLSVVDTPGVDERGVEKLGLRKMMEEATELCHFVVYTMMPDKVDTEESQKFFPQILNVNKEYPTMVLITYKDRNPELLKAAKNQQFREDVSSKIGASERQQYPIDQVFIVSAKYKIVAQNMLQKLASKSGSKPLLPEDDEFIQFALKNNYEKYEEEEFTVDSIQNACKKLLNTGGLDDAMKSMETKGTSQSSRLSSRKGIQELISTCQLYISYLQPALTSAEVDLTNQQEKLNKCQSAIEGITKAVTTTRKEIKDTVQKFRKTIEARSDAIISDFLKNNNASQRSFRDFKTKSDAEKTYEEFVANYLKEFSESLNPLVAELQEQESRSAKTLTDEAKERFLQHLRPLYPKETLENERLLAHEVPPPSMEIDVTSLKYDAAILGEKREATSFSTLIKKITQGESLRRITLNQDFVRKEMTEAITSRTHEWRKLAIKKVSTELNKFLDRLYLRSLTKVNLIKENLENSVILQRKKDDIHQALADLQEDEKKLQENLKVDELVTQTQ